MIFIRSFIKTLDYLSRFCYYHRSTKLNIQSLNLIWKLKNRLQAPSSGRIKVSLPPTPSRSSDFSCYLQQYALSSLCCDHGLFCGADVILLQGSIQRSLGVAAY